MRNYFKNVLKRDKQNKMIAGVCSGIGNYWEIDPTFIRVIFIVSLLIPISGFSLIYVLIWVLTPYDNVEVKNFKNDKYSNE
jgi:phage shock protein PspC (stress-responsive transcriptional regulator)